MRFVVPVTLLSFALAACSATPTQLLVVIDSDLTVPSELSSVRVITRRNDATVSQIDFPVGLVAGPTTQVLPFSFGVVPSSSGDLTERVRITAQALDALGDVVVEQTALVGFRPGQTLLLPMFLLRSCRTVVCGPGLTCTRQGCVSEWVSTLPVILPGSELSYDASLFRADVGGIDASESDGGMDAAADTLLPDVPSADVFVVPGSDVPTIDTSIDTGIPSIDVPTSIDAPSDVPPTGCTACAALGWGCASACADGARCECGGGCACDILCGMDDDCIADCGGGSLCGLDVRRTSNADVYCDGSATCIVDAREAGNLDAFCSGNATCVVDCERVSNCFVACTESASCEVDCTRASNCAFTACGGGEASCPGDVITCNRPCP